MVQNLITKLIISLSCTQPSRGYKTRIEPKLGQISVIHETLDFGPLATPEKLTHFVEFRRSRELPKIQPLPIDWDDEYFTFKPISSNINPATGLPMMNEALDIAGNVFGASNNDITLGLDLN